MLTPLRFAPSRSRRTDDRSLLAAPDRLCILWNLETGRESLRLPIHKGPITSVAFSPDGKRILSASETGEVSLWSASTGELALTYGQNLQQANCVAFSADGRLIVSGHNKTAIAPSQGSIDPFPDCSVRIWDVDSGKLLHRFAWKDFGPTNVVFSPDADRVAAIMMNGPIRIWKLPEGQEVENFDPDDGSSPGAIRLLPRGFDALIDNVDIWFYRSR